MNNSSVCIGAIFWTYYRYHKNASIPTTFQDFGLEETSKLDAPGLEKSINLNQEKPSPIVNKYGVNNRNLILTYMLFNSNISNLILWNLIPCLIVFSIFLKIPKM
jgi:hypothetical protein